MTRLLSQKAIVYQGKARNGHGPAPRVKAYQGAACNHPGAWVRRFMRKLCAIKFPCAVVLSLGARLYQAVR